MWTETPNTPKEEKMFLIEAETAQGYETAKVVYGKEEMYKAVKALMQDDYTEFRIHKAVGVGEFEQLDLELVKSALRHPARANY